MIAPVAQKMIGVRKRDKALGMLGSQENVRGILDADNIVGRRVKHQQRFAQVDKAIVDVLLCDVVEEFALDAERPSNQ